MYLSVVISKGTAGRCVQAKNDTNKKGVQQITLIVSVLCCLYAEQRTASTFHSRAVKRE